MLEWILPLAGLLVSIGAYYITRTLPMTQAVNTFSNTTGELGAGPTDITVPQGVSRIVSIIADLSASVVAVASAGGNVVLRLTGNGLVNGQQDIAIGGFREDTTSTGGFRRTVPFQQDVDIPVISGNSVQPALAYSGVDAGTPEAAITLVFA